MDTNIASKLIRNPAGRAAQRARLAGEAVCVSVIVAAELRYGCAKKGSPRLLRRVKEFLSEVPVLAFDVPADGACGNIRAELEATGRPIGSNDSLIAAHAHTLGAILVTANVGEFERIRGLNVENWLDTSSPKTASGSDRVKTTLDGPHAVVLGMRHGRGLGLRGESGWLACSIPDAPRVNRPAGFLALSMPWRSCRGRCASPPCET